MHDAAFCFSPAVAAQLKRDRRSLIDGAWVASALVPGVGMRMSDGRGHSIRQPDGAADPCGYDCHPGCQSIRIWAQADDCNVYFQKACTRMDELVTHYETDPRQIEYIDVRPVQMVIDYREAQTDA